MTDIVEVPPAPVVPPFPALGSNNYNDEAYAAGVALPGLSAGIHAIGVAARTNAVAAKEQAQAAVASKNAATAQADAAMGYRNEALAAGGNSTAEADRSRSEADRASVQAARAQTEADASMGYRNASQTSASNAATEADRARAEADRAEDAADSISSGPITSITTATGIKTGAVTLSSTDIAPTATALEMQTGTEADYRSMSPALVAQAITGLAKSKIVRSERTANTALSVADNGKWIDITSGTFAQTFLAPAALGAGWWCYLRNSGTGDITIPASDGRTNWIMYPGEMRLLQCDGTALWSIVLNAFYKVFTASGNFIKPPGYVIFEGLMWGGGGSGGSGNSSSLFGGGGAGAPCAPFSIESGKLAQSEPVVIGSGGLAALQASGNVGGQSSFCGFSVNGGPRGEIGFPASGGASTGPADIARAQRTDGGRGGTGDGGSGEGTKGGAGIFGAGGGGGATNDSMTSLGGVSKFGGNGGQGAGLTVGKPGDGLAPGGGGGGARYGGTWPTSGAGARGELRIWGVI